ncbi:TetR/AcrR family transcriptional regulator [Gordonia sp. NB41Y]|uniref:TetR/AcrR family transcriptional regulator n=1 Tax=Gordonia sp. NB41Y TaxID=875808 RepID=UPI0021C90141|nr:TetR/AcrR family transcriptional regulator [Gordonia sp. NB41Y]WLP90329.1 TetR/AcrR family transcriptional regulator [Gordonia sp. NB41Y]
MADAEGWEAVSMKAIADRVGLTAMSLYRYVDSKDDIIDLLVDEAHGRAPDDLMRTGDWRAQITDWAAAYATRLRKRPWLSEIPMTRPPVGPNTLSWTEAGVRAFTDTALSGQQKMSALLLVDGFVRQHTRQALQMGELPRRADGHLADDASGAAADPASGPHIDYDAVVAGLIDAEHYPALSAAVSAMGAGPDDDFYREQLDFGLQVILDGLAGLITAAAR